MPATIRSAATTVALSAALAVGGAGAAFAQGRPDPATLIAAQRDAMRRLDFMDGIWRGPAWSLRPSGEKHALTQTERIGPFLDGSLKVIEGRGYEPDGRVGFNAFATISYDVDARVYRIHSYAQGRAGDFAFEPTDDGYVWTIPAGPQATIRYTAVVKDGEWFERGDRVVDGRPPLRIFEMRLKRVGDTGWPAADPVPPN